jgi:CDP-glucose 4,6-dehydratase
MHFSILKKFYFKKKILITGFNGFTGSWLSLFLSELGSEMYGVALFKEKEKENEINFQLKKIYNKIKYFDICNYKKLLDFFNTARPNLVIHLAAESLVQNGYDDPLKTINTNFNGTINILEIIKKKNIPCLIATSDKCYSNKNDNLKINYNEDHALGGDDPYSASKACVEIMINAYNNSFKTKIASVRAGNIIGGGDLNDYRIIPDIFRAIKYKKILKIRNIKSNRPWQYVLDVVSSYLKILYKASNSKIHQRAWNVGPNTSHEVSQIVSYFKKKNNFKISKSKLIFNEKKNLFISNKKTKKNGIQNIYNFNQTLKATADWYENYLKRGPGVYRKSIMLLKEYVSKLNL